MVAVTKPEKEGYIPYPRPVTVPEKARQPVRKPIVNPVPA